MPGQPENETSGYPLDGGGVIKTNTYTQRISNLTLTDVHMAYIDVINLIFACDNLTINGATFETLETPQIEMIGKSDLVNISVKLTQTNNDDFIIE